MLVELTAAMEVHASGLSLAMRKKDVTGDRRSVVSCKELLAFCKWQQHAW